MFCRSKFTLRFVSMYNIFQICTGKSSNACTSTVTLQNSQIYSIFTNQNSPNVRNFAASQFEIRVNCQRELLPCVIAKIYAYGPSFKCQGKRKLLGVSSKKYSWFAKISNFNLFIQEMLGHTRGKRARLAPQLHAVSWKQSFAMNDAEVAASVNTWFRNIEKELWKEGMMKLLHQYEKFKNLAGDFVEEIGKVPQRNLKPFSIIL